jgi:hypothetical protein
LAAEFSRPLEFVGVGLVAAAEADALVAAQADAV